ncbi:MAG: tripartite tricarboxylate transporter TctB family protein [Betaproteobacteria bacterium]|nr:tripartite tricarboxylate transporter TctB family protein [Betaproteobacteria bacterium]
MVALAARKLLVAVTAAVGAGAAWFAVASPSLIANYRPGLAYYESSAFFPRLGLWLCAISAAIVIGQTLSGRVAEQSDEVDAETSRIEPALISFLLFVIYALALPVIGYAPATALFGAATGLLIGLNWKRCLAAGVVAGLAGHVVFARLLGVSFPAPSLLEWMGLG